MPTTVFLGFVSLGGYAVGGRYVPVSYSPYHLTSFPYPSRKIRPPRPARCTCDLFALAVASPIKPLRIPHSWWASHVTGAKLVAARLVMAGACPGHPDNRALCLPPPYPLPPYPPRLRGG